MYGLELAFSDTPARRDARPAHRELMAGLRSEGKVLAGGPYADDSGAVLIFLTDDEQVAQGYVDADPYYRTPGVTVVSLKQWNAVTRHEAIAEL